MNVSPISCTAGLASALDLAVRGVLVYGADEDEIRKNLTGLGFDV